jgi:hypothetical protein
VDTIINVTQPDDLDECLTGGLTRRAVLKGIGAGGLVLASAAALGPLSAAAATSPEQMAEQFKQWMINANGPRGTVLGKSSFGGPANRNYSLKGLEPRKFLQHEHQTWGINLGWTDNASAATERKVRRWFFHKRGSGPIRYGDLIALGNGGNPSFIRYSKRTFGINLDWSNSPVYEWQILGGRRGQPVSTGTRVALFNTKSKAGTSVGEPLIYFDRTVGGDIGWPSSTTWWDNPAFRQAAIAAIGLLIKAGAA